MFKKIIKTIIVITVSLAMILSISHTVFAEDTRVPASGGDTCVYFTVKVNKNQKTLPEKWPDSSYDTKNLSEVEVALKLPKNYSETGDPVPVVMFGEGYGQYITNTHGQGTWGQQFTNAGYAVFEIDNIEGRNFGIKDLGAPAKVRAAMKAFDYIKENYNVLPKFIPIGVSNGTLLALEIMDWYPEYVLCGVIGGPNVSLEESYKASDNWNTNQNSVALYYDFSNKGVYYLSTNRERGPGAYDKTIGLKYDFYGHLYTENGEKYINKKIPPALFCIGANEPATPHRQALEVANALKNSGNTVVIKEYANTAHGPVCSLSRSDIANDVITFMNQYKNFDCQHKTTKKVPAVEPTCKEYGATEGLKCVTCGKMVKQPSKIAPAGHQPGDEATCVSDQICIKCSAVIQPKTNRHTHTGEWIIDGNKKYKKCQYCDHKLYMDNTTQSGIENTGSDKNQSSNNKPTSSAVSGDKPTGNNNSSSSKNQSTANTDKDKAESNITSSGNNSQENTTSNQNNTSSSNSNTIGSDIPDGDNSNKETIIALAVGIGGGVVLLGIGLAIYLLITRKKK